MTLQCFFFFVLGVEGQVVVSAPRRLVLSQIHFDSEGESSTAEVIDAGYSGV